jgi:hypothetical protein
LRSYPSGSCGGRNRERCRWWRSGRRWLRHDVLCRRCDVGMTDLGCVLLGIQELVGSKVRCGMGFLYCVRRKGHSFTYKTEQAALSLRESRA